MSNTKINKLISKLKSGPRLDKYSTRKDHDEISKILREIDMEVDDYVKRNPKEFKKAGGAASFPDLTGDGKVTKKDILKGRGVPGFKNGKFMCAPRKLEAGAQVMPKKNGRKRRA